MLELRSARIKKRWTLLQVAERVRSNVPTLSRVELGIQEPSPALAQKLARLYGVSRKTVYKWYFRTIVRVRKPKLIGGRSIG